MTFEQCSNLQKSRVPRPPLYIFANFFIGIEIGYFSVPILILRGDNISRAVIVPGTTIGSEGGNPPSNSSTASECMII